MINVIHQSPQAPVTKGQAGMSVNIGADAILFLCFAAWVVWKRAIKPTFAEQLGSFFIPVQEERRLNTILAQIGVVTGASRVVLAAFHNGALDSDGYHLQKLSTINTYVKDGCSPMAVTIKNLPITKISYEIEEMLRVADWHEIKYHEGLPENCKAHMQRNSMACMHNRIIRVGNLPIGIISLQYNKDYHPSDEGSRISRTAYEGLLEDLYDQISGILRRRVINPGPVKRLFSQAIGMVKV